MMTLLLRAKTLWSKDFSSFFLNIKKVILGICVLALSACGPDIAPPVSASVVDGGLYLGKYFGDIQKGSEPKSWSLSKEQLGQLYSWIQSHESDWRMVLASPPPPSYSILVVHSDGSHSQIDFYAINESWKHAVHISRTDSNGKFIFGGEMSVSIDDIANLRRLLESHD